MDLEMELKPVRQDHRSRVRTLTQNEIERRIALLTEVVAVAASAGPHGETSLSERIPRWIAPGELVRRMLPYLADN